MQIVKQQAKRPTKPELNEVFNNWSAGYMSYAEAIRARKNALTDMTNCDLYQDGIPGVRWGTIKYGAQPVGEVRGMGTYTNTMPPLMKPVRYMISIQKIDGVGKICTSKDGEPWVVVGGAYDVNSWATFTQSNNRVYVSNKADEMSYYNIATNAIVTYSPIDAPAAPTVTATGLGGSVVTYRVRVSANNEVGETKASVAALVTVGEYRDSWDPNSQSITIEVSPVAGATSYTFYIGTVAGDENFLGNMPQPTSGNVKLIDNNRAAINPFKKAPEGDSTAGPVLGTLTDSNGQLFGTDDKNNPYRYWYSGSGVKSGSFSPFDGGGWVDINLGGKSLPVCVKAFRDGQGQSAMTILTRGAAGAGEVYHQTFADQTVGDYTITYPLIKQANGQAGTYSAMAVVEANNSLLYPTGTNFTTTGTKAQMVNILVSGSISDTIARDLKLLNLAALHKSVGLFHRNRVFWAVPVGSSENNEIWIYDTSLGGAWILRWTIPCTYMWLYEDSAGITHHCILSNGKILEFSETALDDDGVPFASRLSLPTVTFDKSGQQMASVEMVRTLFIRPQGQINKSIYGLTEGGETTQMIANENIATIIDPTGWDATEWDTEEFDYVLPASSSQSKAQLPLNVEIGEIMSQISIDFTTTDPARYLLHSVQVQGKIIPGLYQGDK